MPLPKLYPFLFTLHTYCGGRQGGRKNLPLPLPPTLATLVRMPHWNPKYREKRAPFCCIPITKHTKEVRVTQKFSISVWDFPNACRDIFQPGISQYDAVFRFILPNLLLPVCSSRLSRGLSLSLLLIKTRHLSFPFQNLFPSKESASPLPVAKGDFQSVLF